MVRCLFNNGENRLFDFVKIFKQMEIDLGNVEDTLLENRNFTKFNLHYQTLSWPNIIIGIPDENDNIQQYLRAILNFYSYKIICTAKALLSNIRIKDNYPFFLTLNTQRKEGKENYFYETHTRSCTNLPIGNPTLTIVRQANDRKGRQYTKYMK